MTFQEWLQTKAGRMVSFETMPRMLETVWNASANDAEARAADLLDACQTAAKWFKKNRLPDSQPGPVESKLIDAIEKQVRSESSLEHD